MEVAQGWNVICVVGREFSVCLAVHSTARMGRVKANYANMLGDDIDRYMFILDGREIDDEDTPESLNFVGGEVIMCYRLWNERDLDL